MATVKTDEFDVALGNAQAVSAQRGVADGGAEFVHTNFWSPVLDAEGTPLTLWKPKLGDNAFDIMAWYAGTDDFGCVKGKPHFDIQVAVNMKMTFGKSQASAKRTANMVSRSALGLSDPISDAQAEYFDLAKKNKQSPEWKKAVGLYPKNRSLYLIMVYSDDMQTRKPYLFSPAYKSFGELLESKERLLKKQGKNTLWAHPTKGNTIYIEGVKSTFAAPNGDSIPFTGFSSIEVIDRPKPYTVEMIKKLPSLDTYVTIPTEEEVSEALYGKAGAPAFVEEQQAPVSYEKVDGSAKADFSEDIPF